MMKTAWVGTYTSLDGHDHYGKGPSGLLNYSVVPRSLVSMCPCHCYCREQELAKIKIDKEDVKLIVSSLLHSWAFGDRI